jgi:hypothetical protein
MSPLAGRQSADMDRDLSIHGREARLDPDGLRAHNVDHDW